MKKVSLDGLVQVSEEIVRQVVKYIPEDEESGIRTVLKAADEYKAANMTPIFILDRNSMNILVVAEETWGKRLH
jgi:hypothetical protein